MYKLLLVVSILLASMTASADEAFLGECKKAAAGGQGGGDRLCGCFVEGLAKGAKADELLAIVKAPREGRREVVMGVSDGSRQVMRGCMQGMREGGGGGQGRPAGE